MRATEIARKYRINEWTVHHRLKRAGITKRPNSMNEAEIALARSLRTDGLSYDRIAERVGFSASTVRNMLKRVGRA
ncbi:sigma factor-like helix-turn-helix DNA-binding protein [Agromyces aurantiacus]|uniref:Sigma factor-like helix-turn-helix DNA-binding protein n=1 Tax=Agromyces aurantiacus TaxID=165814 RepID=A0ABV9R3V7_9MICO|nr:sigma factor-like helix-turn-helix DNA-binding protein [Agromyces aurantiacus]MBM7502943.1 DNA-directed RNA polymerase specialized sigma24 family protein [Agromyces aurantiacus]